VEIADPIPFEYDAVHASHDSADVQAFWQRPIQADRVFSGSAAGPG
jgi:hypothetical protein